MPRVASSRAPASPAPPSPARSSPPVPQADRRRGSLDHAGSGCCAGVTVLLFAQAEPEQRPGLALQAHLLAHESRRLADRGDLELEAAQRTPGATGGGQIGTSRRSPEDVSTSSWLARSAAISAAVPAIAETCSARSRSSMRECPRTRDSSMRAAASRSYVTKLPPSRPRRVRTRPLSRRPSSASRAVTSATPRLRERSDSLGSRSPSRSTPLTIASVSRCSTSSARPVAVERREHDRSRGILVAGRIRHVRGAPCVYRWHSNP